MSQWNPQEYLAYIRMSSRKHLLVEGIDDVELFEIFLGQVCKEVAANVIIDNAENLINFPRRYGNREKVEKICTLIRKKKFSYKLVAFVDREFREFIFDNTVADKLNGHNVLDRLVWSRGHSIENYFLIPVILRQSLRSFCTSETPSEIFSVFELNFDTTIRFACAASLAGLSINKLIPIANSIRKPNILNFANNAIQVDTDLWIESLSTKQKLSHNEVNKFIRTFFHWEPIVNSIDPTLLRWFCHGHISFNFILAAFDASTKAVKKLGNAKVCRMLQSEEKAIFNACVLSWAQNAALEKCIYPVELVALLHEIASM